MEKGPLRARSNSVDYIPSQTPTHLIWGGSLGRWLRIHSHLHRKGEKRRDTRLQKIRCDLGCFLEGHGFQYFVLVLLMLDILFLIGELVIETHYEHEEGAHTVEEIFRWSSISILIIFLIEQFLLMFSFGLDYFAHPLYIIDFVVVSVSLIVELILREILAGFLILFRLWRIVRIVHGIIVTVEEKHREHKILLANRVKKVQEEIASGNTSQALAELRSIEAKLREQHNKEKKDKDSHPTEYTGYTASNKKDEVILEPKENQNE